ncbi:MAG: hypothetical protein JWP08_2612 [Bryobacterales bacterium]|nr:hypothetical protein [Bryobacterales bacterium]
MFSIDNQDSKPSSPADCALLLAIPLDRSGFFADLKNPAKDFVRQFQVERPNQTEDSLWRAYEPYASLAVEVCEHAREHGVRVLESATPEDLHNSLRISAVTTLVAHWRSALFRPQDIVAPALVAAYLQDRASTDDRADLVRRLNAVLKASDRRFDDVLPGSAGESAAKQRKWYVRRRELEQQLGPAVKGGAAIEFTRGLCSIPEILAGLSPEFEGVLDLTVCQSVLFAEEVRAKCRHCLVLSSANLTSLDFRLALYAQTIEVLARDPQPFEDAVTKIRSSLIHRYANKHATHHRSAHCS